MYKKFERLEKANKIIQTIAGCGRKFFSHGDKVSHFFIDERGRVWFIDAYTDKAIYTHYTQGRWRGFSEGGTQRSAVIALRDYITKGLTLWSFFGPWPEWYSAGDPWGYGSDMQTVYQSAVSLGIVPAPNNHLQPDRLRAGAANDDSQSASGG